MLAHRGERIEQPRFYKALWGHVGDFAQACEQANEADFSGLEGQVPGEAAHIRRWRRLLEEHQLGFIAEITTAGGYIPERRVTVQGHLDDFARKLDLSLRLAPEFITCLGGCDAWPEEDSLAFFEQAMSLAAARGIDVSFETHRGRSLFNPWVTERACRALPDMKLTCDFSHWCVVCERLIDFEAEQLERVFDQAFHIHARVGYDQGPQVPEPSASTYAPALHAHERWWSEIWQRKCSRGEVVTMTPEFGPDGYQAIDCRSGEPIGDLWEINCWMAARLRETFEDWRSRSEIPTNQSNK